MKFTSYALRSFKGVLSRQFYQTHMSRSLVTSSDWVNRDDENKTTGCMESEEDFEQRIFGEVPGTNSKTDVFFDKMKRLSKLYDGSDSKGNERNSIGDLNFSTLSDGKDGKLKKAATYFQFNPEEIMDDDYKFRPDMNFLPFTTYKTKDLDLTKPGIRKSKKWDEFEVTTEEVLRKADFRNVRFLANFITESGIINKRSKTGIKAKAQRKVAREIKTARAFGLMPFTTMGKKSFVFGNTMEPRGSDYAHDSYDVVVDAEDKDTAEV